ncbi:MAG: hypothetical protein DRI79_01795 [Chloroflexi bacterium]|nr:MAG: hypothetical protein DRI79_01795 [Chloroflexota bacterium]
MPVAVGSSVGVSVTGVCSTGVGEGISVASIDEPPPRERSSSVTTMPTTTTAATTIAITGQFGLFRSRGERNLRLLIDLTRRRGGSARRGIFLFRLSQTLY